jgi:predicted O-methyltransferase YrrM
MWSYFNGQYDRFMNNCKTHIENKKIELIRKLSTEALPELKQKYEEKFDFIYIDGDHRADPVYNDGVLSFELCKPNGYILFDDYEWGSEFGNDAPKIGIDKFLNTYKDKIQVISKNGQVLVKKYD